MFRDIFEFRYIMFVAFFFFCPRQVELPEFAVDRGRILAAGPQAFDATGRKSDSRNQVRHARGQEPVRKENDGTFGPFSQQLLGFNT